MEREKQKLLDKERKLKEAEDAKKMKDQEEAEAEEDLRKDAEARGEIYVPPKSKFVRISRGICMCVGSTVLRYDKIFNIEDYNFLGDQNQYPR